jgi:ABC-type dipeptide/oligopeptide/nickel transport system ATPase component
MLAIGRALMSKPRLLLLDEPTLGLAPLIITQIFEIILTVRAGGVTVFLVEQNANKALQIADRGYVLENGRLVLEDTGANLLKNDAVRQAYLGVERDRPAGWRRRPLPAATPGECPACAPAPAGPRACRCRPRGAHAPLPAPAPARGGRGATRARRRRLAPA